MRVIGRLAVGMLVIIAVGGVACSRRANDVQPAAAATAPPSTAVNAPPTAEVNAPPIAAINEVPGTAPMVRAASDAADRGEAQEAECTGRVAVYEGSIEVDAKNYVQPVAHGSDWIDGAIPDLDRVVSTAPRIDFTLDYPFEKPFHGSITGRITRRRIIDAVRAGFRHMYEGTTQRDIPKLENKDVRGPYGKAFHVIGDLVIERIDLCDGGRLEISIGS